MPPNWCPKSQTLTITVWECSFLQTIVLVLCLNDPRSSLLLVSLAIWLCSHFLLWRGHDSLLLTLTMWTFSGQWDISSNDAWTVLKSSYVLGLALFCPRHHHEKILSKLVHWSPEENERQLQQNHPSGTHKVCERIQQKPENPLNWTHSRLAKHPTELKTCEK